MPATWTGGSIRCLPRHAIAEGTDPDAALITEEHCVMPSDTSKRPTSTSRALADLLDAVLDGHRGAWNELIDRFDPLVTSTLRRYRLRPIDLEDLRQEVWVSVLLHLQELREPRAFPGWIATMTRHQAVRWCTSAHRRGEPTDALLIGDIVRDDAPVASIDDNLVRTEIRSSVRNGLHELPAGDRKLMLLLFGDDDLSYREISQRLGIPTGSIGPTRARCLQKLRRTKALSCLVA